MQYQAAGFLGLPLSKSSTQLAHSTVITQRINTVQDGQDFWQDLEAILAAYGAGSVSQLPIDLQQVITEKLGELPSESELEVAKLDQQEAELLPLVGQRLNRALPSVALLLTWLDLKDLIALLIPQA